MIQYYAVVVLRARSAEVESSHEHYATLRELASRYTISYGIMLQILAGS